MAVDQVLPGIDSALAADVATTVALLQRSTVQVRDGHRGAGSGVIWRPDGLIVTNAHVARGNGATVELWDGRTFESSVVAQDRRRDLAALQIDATDLPAATILDSDALRVGQLVIAVGNPLGLVGAMSMGIVHAIAPAEGQGGGAWVQADVHLAPGNSGGPLADAGGRVVGINSMIAGGLGLAVPSNAVQRFLGGRRAQFGVTMQPVLVPSAGQSVHGMLILEVVPGGAADAAGLIIGDIVVAFDGEAVRGPRSIAVALDHFAMRGSISVDLLRGGQVQTRTVTITETGQTGVAA